MIAAIVITLIVLAVDRGFDSFVEMLAQEIFPALASYLAPFDCYLQAGRNCTIVVTIVEVFEIFIN
jgi:hypothetical protein